MLFFLHNLQNHKTELTGWSQGLGFLLFRDFVAFPNVLCMTANLRNTNDVTVQAYLSGMLTRVSLCINDHLSLLSAVLLNNFRYCTIP